MSIFAQVETSITTENTQVENELLSFNTSKVTKSDNNPNPKETPSSLCNSGVKKFMVSNFSGAISDYNKALLLDPENINALFNRANAKLALKDFEGAIEDYSLVISLEPNDKVAYLQRGLTKIKLDQNKKAIKDFTQAIKLDKRYWNAYYQRGIAKYNLKDFETAMRDFNIVNKYSPNSDVLFSIAKTKMGLGNYSGAKKDLTIVIEMDPGNAEVYFQRGIAYYDGGSKKNAKSDWEIASSMGHVLSAKAIAKYCQ
jgi:tetratricopeptide (TPR) repeat protein